MIEVQQRRSIDLSGGRGNVSHLMVQMAWRQKKPRAQRSERGAVMVRNCLVSGSAPAEARSAWPLPERPDPSGLRAYPHWDALPGILRERKRLRNCHRIPFAIPTARVNCYPHQTRYLKISQSTLEYARQGHTPSSLRTASGVTPAGCGPRPMQVRAAAALA